MSLNSEFPASALRTAGEAMLAARKEVSLSIDRADSPSSRIVRRSAGVRAPVKRAITFQPEFESLLSDATLADRRVQLHSFIPLGVRRESRSRGLTRLTRRQTIDPVADLPDLRCTNCSEACMALAFSPDGSQLAGGFYDGMVRIFDGHSGVEDRCGTVQTEDHFGSPTRKAPSVTNLCWFSDSTGAPWVATTDAAGSICLWDTYGIHDQKMSCSFQAGSGHALHALCVTEDCSRIAVGGTERVVRVFDIQHGSATATLQALPKALGDGPTVPGRIGSHNLKIVSLCASPTNPQIMYSAGIDRKILRWDLRAGFDAVGQIHGPHLSGDSMDISKNGQTLLVAGYRGAKQLQLFDMRRLSTPHSTLAEPYASYSWNGDEETTRSSCLLFGASWDSQTNKIVATAGQHENVAKAFVLPNDPREPIQPIGSLENQAGGFWSAAVVPDGNCVAFGSADGSVHLVDLAPTSP